MLVGKRVENTAPQNSVEWLQARLGKITGSRVGELMTRGKGKDAQFGKTSLGYLMSLATDLFYECPEPQISNYAMNRGHELEPYAIEAFTDATGLDVRPTGFVEVEGYPYFGCSVDGTIDDESIVEVKCRFRKGYVDRIIEGIPKKDMMQMQWNMLITDTSKCYYINYTDEMMMDNLLIECVEADEVMQRDMLEKALDAVEVIEDYYEQICSKVKELNPNKKEN